MQTFLPKEYVLMQLKKEVPFDAGKAIMEQDAIIRLASSAAPIKMTVNQFRMLQVGYRYDHPDERGSALVSDADVVKAGDAFPTLAELQALRDELIRDNEGAYNLGLLQTKYADLFNLITQMGG